MSNPYARFLHLLPKQHQWIGQIVSISTSGDAVVAIAGTGDQVKVKGIVTSGTASETYSIGDYVYVVDGVIQSKISDLQTAKVGTII